MGPFCVCHGCYSGRVLSVDYVPRSHAGGHTYAVSGMFSATSLALTPLRMITETGMRPLRYAVSRTFSHGSSGTYTVRLPDREPSMSVRSVYAFGLLRYSSRTSRTTWLTDVRFSHAYSFNWAIIAVGIATLRIPVVTNGLSLLGGPFASPLFSEVVQGVFGSRPVPLAFSLVETASLRDGGDVIRVDAQSVSACQSDFPALAGVIPPSQGVSWRDGANLPLVDSPQNVPEVESGKPVQERPFPHPARTCPPPDVASLYLFTERDRPFIQPVDLPYYPSNSSIKRSRDTSGRDDSSSCTSDSIVLVAPESRTVPSRQVASTDVLLSPRNPSPYSASVTDR
jgi:hypothetical protein